MAIIPNMIKAGFVVGGRHGRGVIVVREPDGSWSNPIFLTLAGSAMLLLAQIDEDPKVMLGKT